jgi:hypothetical protein
VTWIPLVGGEGDDRKRPVASAGGWQMPSYAGVTRATAGWLGLRLDDYIVVDCDSEEARDAWLRHVDKGIHHTWVRKTPNGWHFFYLRTAQSIGVRTHDPLYIAEKINLKAGKGQYVVFHAPGYDDWTGSSEADMGWFNPAWVKQERQKEVFGDEWSEMPEGIGDNAMTSIAGVMRRWGMDQQTVARCLVAVNEITMTKDPMPVSAIKRIARSVCKHGPEEQRTVLCPSCGTDVSFV